MGRAESVRKEWEAELDIPVKRPADWAGELPEDPILSTQLPSAPVQVLAPRTKRVKLKSPSVESTVAKKPEKGLKKEGSLKQYNILAALGIKPQTTNSGGEENEPPLKKQKKETRTPMQLFQQLASKMWKPRSSQPEELEGVVEKRSDASVQELETSPPSFQVHLQTLGTDPSVPVIFSGAAARVFHRSCLQRGSHIRIQGFTRFVRDGVEELHFNDVHPGVSVKVLATAAMSQSTEVLHLCDLQRHLDKVKKGEAKAMVAVEAVAKHVGKLEHQELAMQPGEFAATRTIELSESDGHSVCLWRLWDSQAEQFGETLLGHRLVIHSARVREVHGHPELTGCASMSIKSA